MAIRRGLNSEYRSEHEEFLLSGHDFFHQKPFGEPPDENLMREMWEGTVTS